LEATFKSSIGKSAIVLLVRSRVPAASDPRAAQQQINRSGEPNLSALQGLDNGLNPVIVGFLPERGGCARMDCPALRNLCKKSADPLPGDWHAFAPPRIGIIGSGAIGGFYGLMLARAGFDVHFLLRSEYQAVCERGLSLDSAVHGALHMRVQRPVPPTCRPVTGF
jgi:hypothetical protein